MHLTHERMSDAFEKHHVHGLPVAAAFHHFTEPDTGDCHCHPFSFTSHILSGGYVERVFALDGSYQDIHRKPGDSVRVKADHIHLIIELPEGECWTLIQPGPHIRTSRVYQFREGQAYSRAWHEREFTLHAGEGQREAA